MARTVAPLLPAQQDRLAQLGERLRLARRRRKLSAAMVAERAGMSRVTLTAVEKGMPGVTMGAYLAVMQVLGLDAGLDRMAADDALGRELQDASLQPNRPRPHSTGATRRANAATPLTAPGAHELKEPAPEDYSAGLGLAATLRQRAKDRLGQESAAESEQRGSEDKTESGPGGGPGGES
jgi:transcriptional regulator with XRE-family HTH domain